MPKQAGSGDLGFLVFSEIQHQYHAGDNCRNFHQSHHRNDIPTKRNLLHFPVRSLRYKVTALIEP